jgi:ribonuclease HII
MPSLDHENLLRAAGFQRIAGIDEAGRRPLAGPVSVAAVILPADFDHAVMNDSKKLSHSIAAARSIAKVRRDRLMVQLAESYPGYGFEIHKGYPTPAHQQALKKLGPCPAHRRSFATVAQLLLNL